MASELKQMGRYLIERVLGKGAMGVVYLARDPVIGRFVALKTLNVPADSEDAVEFRQRFLREAQAAGILNHPGIVTVFDAGVDLNDIVRAVNQVGAAPGDLVAILEALRQAGSLRAELVVI